MSISPMRKWTFAWACLTTLVIVVAAAVSYGSHQALVMSPEIAILSQTATVLWIAFVGAYVRDEIIQRRTSILVDLHQKLDDLPQHIADYGDSREAAGHRVAARGRTLHTVD